MLIMKPSARLYNAMEEEMCERFETTFTPLESRFLHNVSSRKSNEHGKRKWHKKFLLFPFLFYGKGATQTCSKCMLQPIDKEINNLH